mmetsp:Transcript_13123/g.27777  ORF Transcript_13123/g.27777 Transcript_13123/m.27777 type:complete len:241 (-) Transcript_13123:100-822(-)
MVLFPSQGRHGLTGRIHSRRHHLDVPHPSKPQPIQVPPSIRRSRRRSHRRGIHPRRQMGRQRRSRRDHPSLGSQNGHEPTRLSSNGPKRRARSPRRRTWTRIDLSLRRRRERWTIGHRRRRRRQCLRRSHPRQEIGRHVTSFRKYSRSSVINAVGVVPTHLHGRRSRRTRKYDGRSPQRRSRGILSIDHPRHGSLVRHRRSRWRPQDLEHVSRRCRGSATSSKVQSRRWDSGGNHEVTVA